VSDWYSEPTIGELRAPRPADEHPVRHTRRRNTKKWCGGKEGVKHTLEIRVKRGVASRRAQPHKDGRDRYVGLARQECGWSCWAWRLYGDWNYWCAHEWHCTRCKKIFPIQREECPEFAQHPKPTTSAEETERREYEERMRLRAEARTRKGRR
jgi:hypothetical protein